jgi:hypothetical protein
MTDAVSSVGLGQEDRLGCLSFRRKPESSAFAAPPAWMPALAGMTTSSKEGLPAQGAPWRSRNTLGGACKLKSQLTRAS